MTDQDCEPMQTEKVRKKDLLAMIDALNARVAQLEQRVSYQQAWTTPIAWNTPTTTPPDCGCPTGNYVCNNYICPRAVRVTS